MPAPHERAVLVLERHDVGDGGERDEVGELIERRRQSRGSPPWRRDQSAWASLSTTPVPQRSANG